MPNVYFYIVFHFTVVPSDFFSASLSLGSWLFSSAHIFFASFPNISYLNISIQYRICVPLHVPGRDFLFFCFARSLPVWFCTSTKSIINTTEQTGKRTEIKEKTICFSSFLFTFFAVAEQKSSFSLSRVCVYASLINDEFGINLSCFFLIHTRQNENATNLQEMKMGRERLWKKNTTRRNLHICGWCLCVVCAFSFFYFPRCASTFFTLFVLFSKYGVCSVVLYCVGVFQRNTIVQIKN